MLNKGVSLISLIVTIVVIIILIMFSAYFSATETAFTSLNRVRMKNLAGAGDQRAKKVLDLEETMIRISEEYRTYQIVYNLPELTIKNKEWDLLFETVFHKLEETSKEDKLYEYMSFLLRYVIAYALVKNKKEISYTSFTDQICRLEYMGIKKEDINSYIGCAVQRYKEKFPEKSNVSYSFICEEDTVSIADSILSVIIALTILSVSVAKTHFTFTVSAKFGGTAFSVCLDGVKITENIFSFGFPGLFLSHMEKLNTLKTEQTYSAPKLQTVISVTVPKQTNHCRLHSKRTTPNYTKYASAVTEIMLLT